MTLFYISLAAVHTGMMICGVNQSGSSVTASLGAEAGDKSPLLQ